MRPWLHRAALAVSLLLAGPAMAQQVTVPLNAIPVGKGPGFTGFKTVLGSAGSGAKCLIDTTPPTFGTCPTTPSGSLTVGTSAISGGTTSTPLLNVGGVLANGTRSGNTTSYATTTGTLTSQDCVKFDASGNLAANGGPCTFIYDTVATATAATIPAANTMIFLRGNNAVGDAGAGWWVRNASLPAHTMYFQSADGAYWVPSLNKSDVNFEQLGGRCGGSGFDNTAALNKYNSWITSVGQVRVNFQGCVYYFNTLPSTFTVAPNFNGTGSNGTALMRNVNGTPGIGFIDITGASGAIIQNLSIEASSGTSGGAGISFNATSSNGASGSFLSNVTIAGLGSNNFDIMITLDGRTKTTGAIGTRDHNWSNVILFGSNILAVNGLSVEGLTWSGGAVYSAGGTSAASITLTGNNSGMASSSIMITLGNGANIDLDFCVRCILRAPGWTGSSNNSANAINCGVAGAVTGTKQTNWTTSSYLAF
jgi:hypothetical protein